MSKIDEYVDRYFEGGLSEQEERELKDFLCTPQGQASEYDEVRAVMGFFSAGRRLYCEKKPSGSGRIVPAGAVFARLSAVAAGLFVLISLGISVYNKDNVCVSFVDGVKVTDKEVVMNDLESTLEDLLSEGTDVDGQLDDIFNKQQK